MNTLLSRANTIFAFTLSILAALTFMCFLTTVGLDTKKDVKITTVKHSVRHTYTQYGENADLGGFYFDLQANLDPLFNWNTKQLFIYLTAEYETNQNKLNQVVIWDKIIKRTSNANINFNRIQPKYPFFDDGHGLKNNQNITLTLSWNIIPNAGLLPRVYGNGKDVFAFPSEYTTHRI
ncbi:signal peptidase complex subunit 3-like [Lytechinus pictus]|uniref:signal peptidase complex subunit 3-like n=1 Tax=Lytechinus pictus TaxID=7653 RepID=UPI0030B9E4B3